MSQPDDRELDRRIAKLPRSISPEHDLWTDIEKRIATPRPASFFAVRRRRLVVLGLGSMVAAAAAVTLFVAGRVRKPSWPWPSPVPTAVAVEGMPPAWPDAGMHVVLASPPASDVLENAKERATYRAAVQALEATLAESRGSLSPEAAHRIDQSLGVLDSAIEATERALTQDPESVELRSQLWEEYEQKIEALTVVVDLVARTS